jgi:hypothetical protein
LAQARDNKAQVRHVVLRMRWKEGRILARTLTLMLKSAGQLLSFLTRTLLSSYSGTGITGDSTGTGTSTGTEYCSMYTRLLLTHRPQVASSFYSVRNGMEEAQTVIQYPCLTGAFFKLISLAEAHGRTTAPSKLYTLSMCINGNGTVQSRTGTCVRRMKA